jgi:hypothetical protein
MCPLFRSDYVKDPMSGIKYPLRGLSSSRSSSSSSHSSHSTKSKKSNSTTNIYQQGANHIINRFGASPGFHFEGYDTSSSATEHLDRQVHSAHSPYGHNEVYWRPIPPATPPKGLLPMPPMSASIGGYQTFIPQRPLSPPTYLMVHSVPGPNPRGPDSYAVVPMEGLVTGKVPAAEVTPASSSAKVSSASDDSTFKITALQSDIYKLKNRIDASEQATLLEKTRAEGFKAGFEFTKHKHRSRLGNKSSDISDWDSDSDGYSERSRRSSNSSHGARGRTRKVIHEIHTLPAMRESFRLEATSDHVSLFPSHNGGFVAAGHGSARFGGGGGGSRFIEIPAEGNDSQGGSARRGKKERQEKLHKRMITERADVIRAEDMVRRGMGTDDKMSDALPVYVEGRRYAYA